MLPTLTQNGEFSPLHDFTTNLTTNYRKTEMKGSDIFPSNYIKADDLQGREVPVTISHATIEKLGNDQKLILYFKGKEKGMVCNKTNFGRIAFLYGDETDNWTDKPVILAAEFVEFQGKSVKGLRVRPPGNTKIQQQPVRETENPAGDIPF